MSTIIAKGKELVRAMHASDVDALRRLLSPDFRGELTAGLPLNLGGVYAGVDSMINEGWGSVRRHFQIWPQVDRLYDCGDVLIGVGEYVGTARTTGKTFHAAFAHLWDFDGQRFTGVRQVTDSATWEQALR